MPHVYDDEFPASRILVQAIFTWFSVNTLLSIFRVLTSDPGYIDDKYKHPLNANGEAPLERLRLYNMQSFKINNLYDFAIQDEEEDSCLIASNNNESVDTSVDASDAVEMKAI